MSEKNIKIKQIEKNIKIGTDNYCKHMHPQTKAELSEILSSIFKSRHIDQKFAAIVLTAFINKKHQSLTFSELNTLYNNLIEYSLEGKLTGNIPGFWNTFVCSEIFSTGSDVTSDNLVSITKKIDKALRNSYSYNGPVVEFHHEKFISDLTQIKSFSIKACFLALSGYLPLAGMAIEEIVDILVDGEWISLDEIMIP